MIKPTFEYENKQWGRGVHFIAGIDEVGRGSWVGPVVAAAVIFDKSIEVTFNDVGLGNVKDSKLLTENHREKLAELIKKHALAYAIGEISLTRINKYGIGKSSQYAFRKAIKGLKIEPQHILIDAFYIKYLKKKAQTPIIKGDQKCFSIAAASIIAKVYRDNLMKDLHTKYPKWKIDKHKGYGTKEHRELIKKYGLSKIHRTSFNIKVANM